MTKDERRIYNKKYWPKWAAKNQKKIQKTRKNYQWRLVNDSEAHLRRMLANRDNRLRLKGEVFDVYGGRFCACCGLDEGIDFLTLDHIHNNGAEERERLMGDRNIAGLSFYRKLKTLGYPKGYQVLCFNCNCGKNANGGICPHKSEAYTPVRRARLRKKVKR